MTTTVAALADATGLLGDAGSLRERMTRDGYLFLPGLLDPERVRGVRADVLRALAGCGWLAPDTDPLVALPGPQIRNFGDDSWWEGYAAILRLESFNALAHAEPVLALMRALVGESLLVQPMKIARVTYPGSGFPTNPHQDFFFVRGATDVITAWIPLGDCPPALGGLQVAPGSHVTGLHPVRPAFGSAGVTAEVPGDITWHSADYRAGDVVVFHSMTLHHAPANEGSTLRLSTDCRYQSVADRIVAPALMPHEFGNGRVPGWGALSADWSTTRWIEVPDGIRLAPWRPDPAAVPESRFARD